MATDTPRQGRAARSEAAAAASDEAQAFDAALADDAEAPDSGQHDGSASAPDEATAEREKNLRLLAELENVRSRTAREMTEQARYAALPLARDLLAAMDNVDRAIEHAQQAGEEGSLLEGFRLVRSQLKSILEQHQVVEIPALGQEFDPQFHAAILHQPSTEYPADHVSQVALPGYRLHDRVVRPAQVIVSSGAPAG